MAGNGVADKKIAGEAVAGKMVEEVAGKVGTECEVACREGTD